MLGWWSTNYIVGGLAAATVTSYVSFTLPMFSSLGWRRGFLGPGAFVILVSYLLFAFGKYAPSREEDEAPPEPLTRRAHFITVLSAVFLVTKLIRYAFLFWIPYYFVDMFHYTPTRAAVASSAFELAGIPGSLITGYASDRLFAARRFPVLGLLTLLLSAALGLRTLSQCSGYVFNVGWVATVGFAIYGIDTLISGAASRDLATCDRPGQTANIVGGIGSVGQIASAHLVAATKLCGGWKLAFLACSLISVVASSVLAKAWRSESRLVIPRA
jgi:sugar phosphate permease